MANELPKQVSLIQASSSESIAGLSLDESIYPLQGTDPKKLSVTLTGKFSDKEARLLWNTTEVILDPDFRFHLTLPLTAKPAYFDFVTVDRLGNIKRQRMILTPVAPLAVPAKLAVYSPPLPQNTKGVFHFTPALGFSSESYQDNLATKFQSSYLALFIDIGFSKAWLKLNARASSTAFSFSHSTVESVRFFRANAWADFNLLRALSLWQLDLGVGAYVDSMYVSQNTFGYAQVSGPEIFPVFSYTRPSGKKFSLKAKFSPVSSGLSILALSNRKLSAGLSYAWPLKKTLQASQAVIEFQFSSLQISNESVSGKAVSTGAFMGLQF